MKRFTQARMVLTITLLMATLTVASAYIVAPASAQVDDWPMFHHDAAHSGYSSSSAPSPFIIGWEYTTGGMVRSSPAVVNGKVYIGSDDHYLYCLDADTGNQNWKFETEGEVGCSPAVEVGTGRVYFGSYDTWIYCVNANSGSQIWRVKTGGPVFSSPCVVAGVVYIGSNDGYLYALDAADGSLVWRSQMATYSFHSLQNRSMSNCWSSPAVVDGKVYIGSFDKRVYRFDAATGNQDWNFTTGSGLYGASPTVAYGYVYIGSDDFYFYWLDAETGTEAFRYMFPERISTTWLESTAAFHNNRVFVGYPHALSCFDVATKTRLWWGRTGSAQKSSVAIADGKCYIGGQDSYFWCYDEANGEQLQNYGKFQGAISSSPAIYNGKIYVGCWDNNVYCFVQGTPTVISCWSDPQILTFGDSVWIRGSIAPAVSGATVTVSYLKPDATLMERTVTSGTDGSYEDSYTPDMEGDWSVKASWPGSATHGGSVSTAVAFVSPAVFNVKPVAKIATTINCWLGWPTSLPLGETQYTRGAIAPAVSGATVTLTYTIPDGTTMTRTVTSGTDGSYEDPYTPDVTGTYSVKASWAGSATHISSNSILETFIVTEEAEAAEEAIPMEYIYAIIAVIVIAVVAIAAYMVMRRR